MSRQNVDIVRRLLEDYSATGEASLEALDPAVEVVDHDIPDADVYRGHEGYTRWFANWSQAWESFSFEPEEWIDAGDQVVLIFMLTARGKGSGVEVKRRDAIVWTMRDGLAVRVDYYNNTAQALEAIGLR